MSDRNGKHRLRPYFHVYFVWLFYKVTHNLMNSAAGKIPAVVKETVAGICPGLAGMAVPMIMFSGEEQMGTLMETYANYLSVALIAVAFLNVFITNFCIV